MRPPPLAPPVSPRAGSPAPQRLHAARYRVWQMWRALFPGRLDAADRAILEQTLPPAGPAAFSSVGPPRPRRSPAHRWRRPFYLAGHHAEIGADLAAAAGLPARSVLLIRTHHQPGGPAAELHAVDEGL